MNKGSLWSLGLVVAIAVVCSAPLNAQTGAASTRGKPIPRTVDGKPDFSGIWIANGAMLLLFGEDEVKAVRAADAAAGRPAPTPREPPPYKPEAEAKRQYYVARRGIDDPMARCLISGVPRITARPLPFQIVQLPGRSFSLRGDHALSNPKRWPSASRRLWPSTGRFGGAMGRRDAGCRRDEFQHRYMLTVRTFNSEKLVSTSDIPDNSRRFVIR